MGGLSTSGRGWRSRIAEMTARRPSTPESRAQRQVTPTLPFLVHAGEGPLDLLARLVVPAGPKVDGNDGKCLFFEPPLVFAIPEKPIRESTIRHLPEERA